MLTILTLSAKSSFDKSVNEKSNHSGNNTADHNFDQELTAEKYRKMENFITILPVLIMLLGIIIMSILYDLFI